MNRATLSSRLSAFLIDYMIWALISVPVVLIFKTPSPSWTDGQSADSMPEWQGISMVIIGVLINVLFYLRDTGEQSPGKKVLNLQVLKKSNHETPSTLVLLTRNVFLALVVIELIVFLFDKNNERIGDKVTRTYVSRIS